MQHASTVWEDCWGRTIKDYRTGLTAGKLTDFQTNQRSGRQWVTFLSLIKDSISLQFSLFRTTSPQLSAQFSFSSLSDKGLGDKGRTLIFSLGKKTVFLKNHSRGFISAENHETCEWSILMAKVRWTLSERQNCWEVTVGFSFKNKDF